MYTGVYDLDIERELLFGIINCNCDSKKLFKLGTNTAMQYSIEVNINNLFPVVILQFFCRYISLF